MEEDPIDEKLEKKLGTEVEQIFRHDMRLKQPRQERALTNKVAELYAAARAVLDYKPGHPSTDPVGDKNTKDAEEAFCNFAEWIINQLGELSRQGQSKPLRAAWNGGRVLAEAIHDVALNGIEKQAAKTTGYCKSKALLQIARNALYMPSLRAPKKVFDYDSEQIAKDIHLAEDFPIRADPKAKSQLNAPSTRFIVGQLEYFMWLKSEYLKTKSEYEKLKPSSGRVISTNRDSIRSAFFHSLALPFKKWLEGHYGILTAKDLILCAKAMSRDGASTKESFQKFLRSKIDSCKDLTSDELYCTNFKSLVGNRFYEDLKKRAQQFKKSTKAYTIRDELVKSCTSVLRGSTLFR